MSEGILQATSTGFEAALLHFTSNRQDRSKLPLIVSARGLTVTDAAGREYMDGLAGLYTTQVGHGREEIAEAAARQIRELDFFPSWNAMHPRALELSDALVERAPFSDGGGAAFFVNSGSEAVEAMLKVARQYHQANGEPDRATFIARNYAYHGATHGALALTGLPPMQEPFEPLSPAVIHVSNTHEDPEGSADAIEAAIESQPAGTVAAVVLEPVQNAGGSFVPPAGYWERVREICDGHGVLLVADATICAFGRIGTWFGIERFGVEPDIITFAKGLTSGYVPMGGLVISPKVQAVLDGEPMFLHGATFGGHPVAAAVALKNIEILEREDLFANVLDLEQEFGDVLRALGPEHPLIADVRGLGFFWTIELDTSWPDGRPLEGDDYDRHFKHGLFEALLSHGLMCRVDDRDSPVIQFSPPLTADREALNDLAAMAGRAVGDLERALGY